MAGETLRAGRPGSCNAICMLIAWRRSGCALAVNSLQNLGGIRRLPPLKVLDPEQLQMCFLARHHEPSDHLRLRERPPDLQLVLQDRACFAAIPVSIAALIVRAGS